MLTLFDPIIDNDKSKGPCQDNHINILLDLTHLRKIIITMLCFWKNLLFVVLMCRLTLCFASKDTSLLMIGNSFTAANDLEEIVRRMLNEDVDFGGHVYAMEFRKPSARLIDDVENDNIRSTIGERAWTWVVIQEQSQIPTFWNSAFTKQFNSSIAAAKTVDKWISNAKGHTVLLMTWGQRFGDHMNLDISPNFPVMQERLKVGYGKMQEHLSTPERPVLVIPAGMAFKSVYDASGSDPTADGTDFTRLFADDGKHPSMEGSYLAACVIYNTLSGKHPSHLKYKPRNMSVERAQSLQNVAGSATVRYNEINRFNQQYYEAVNESKNIDNNQSNQKEKKPYVPSGGGKTTDSAGIRSTWLFLAAMVAFLATVTFKRQIKWGFSSRHVQNPSVYRQIHTDDMELVDVAVENDA